jgi:hypothetical protein
MNTRSKTNTSTHMDIDTRLALAHIAMDVRLGNSSVDISTVEVDDMITFPHRQPIPLHTGTTAATTLTLARELINELGWFRGGRTNPDTGAVCALEAIDRAAANSKVAGEAAEELMVRIHRVYGPSQPNIAHWNDDPKRTEREVLRVLY